MDLDLDIYQKHNLSKIIEREIMGENECISMKMGKEYNLEFKYSDKIKNFNLEDSRKR